MSEQAAYQRLRKAAFTPHDRVDRVENIVLSGMPDVNYCVEGREGWIEIKTPTEPKRALTRLFASNHNLSQEQKNWFKRQCNAGGLAWVYIESDKTRMLIDGKFADRVNDCTTSELIGLASWVRSINEQGKEQWKTLRNIL